MFGGSSVPSWVFYQPWGWYCCLWDGWRDVFSKRRILILMERCKFYAFLLLKWHQLVYGKMSLVSSSISLYQEEALVTPTYHARAHLGQELLLCETNGLPGACCLGEDGRGSSVCSAAGNKKVITFRPAVDCSTASAACSDDQRKETSLPVLPGRSRLLQNEGCSDCVPKILLGELTVDVLSTGTMLIVVISLLESSPKQCHLPR